MTESPGSIFVRFLKFGCLAWGGPAAQIAMIKRECVDEEGWVSEESFARTLAVYQVLPGPEAHELCVYFGRIRGGRRGGILAGLGFMLPGLLLMLGLCVLYVEADMADQLGDLFYGLAAAIAGVVARALLRLNGAFVTNGALAAIALAVFLLALLVPIGFVALLLGAGIAYELWSGRRRRELAAFALPQLAVLLGAAAIALPLGAAIFGEGLKAGLLTFGGAFTAIPLLEQSAVSGHGWLTESQFVDGLAIGSVLPAPLIIFGTFVGYLAGGLGGALAMTLGIFLPAFLLPTFFHRQLVAAAESERIRPFLLGVAAAVVGLIGAVAVTIVETSVVDVPAALLAVGAFLALIRWHAKLTVLYVVLGCGLIGLVVQALGG